MSCMTLQAQKTVTATRAMKPISADGKLDEVDWQNAIENKGFTTMQNSFGEESLTDVSVRMIYDNDYVYIGAYMPAQSRADIKTELAERDGVGNSDWFLIMLDTYGGGTDALEFLVTSAGVQFDAKIGNNGEDESWDEVWRSGVHLTDDGWYAEMAIPYSAIRFPDQDVQHWKVNFIHNCISTGQKCSYFELDPNVPGFVNQAAPVNGVEGIKAPKRLSLTPYATAYAQSYNPKDGSGRSNSVTYNGGMDLKFGLSDAFTVDMTLIPDFGQVRADDRILNLSPFEVQFNENRAFFTEGIELFSKANLFYSRRIGGTPIGKYRVNQMINDDERIITNPNNAKLYNATKVSGRFKNGLGLGVLNAVSRATYATVENQEGEMRKIKTAPLTNYNVTVLDQILPQNSFISLINTNVTRFGDEFKNANVTGTEFNINRMNQTLQISGDVALSQELNKTEDNRYGLKYNVEIGKTFGSFSIGASTAGISKEFDINDLGYSTITNTKDYGINMNYRFSDGIGMFSFMNTWFGSYLTTNYDDNQYQSLNFNAGFWARTKEQWTFNMWTNYGPRSYDFFEARTPGVKLEVPAYFNMGWYIGSDQRKPFSVGINPFVNKKISDPGYYYSIELSPRMRFNDRFSVGLNTSINNYGYGRGYVSRVDDEPIIGLRARNTISNVFSMKYSFSKDITLTGRVRHYWTAVDHTSYHTIDESGKLLDSDFDGVNPYTYNDVNVNFNLRYRFAPGSDIILQWQNNIAGSQSFSSENFNEHYFSGLKSLSDLGVGNNVSIRVLYYINGGRFI